MPKEVKYARNDCAICLIYRHRLPRAFEKKILYTVLSLNKLRKQHMLPIGTHAPSFTLTDQNGDSVSLSDFIGKWVILYFYPKALTPGCTVQACSLSDSQDELASLNAIALGVSADDTKKLKKFEEKHTLNFTLLGDTTETHDTLLAYKAWGPKKFMGREYDGIHRITYIIDPQGKIVHTIEKVKTKSHHEDVIHWLKEHTHA